MTQVNTFTCQGCGRVETVEPREWCDLPPNWEHTGDRATECRGVWSGGRRNATCSHEAKCGRCILALLDDLIEQMRIAAQAGRY